ncbi:hypothetical protein HMPREF0880_01204 [Yokenella regensburgei ATCC 43003]|nr:hypothetical protein HMPREF0880_01204 [Yokenella regensburgei ATCC 43003]
MRYIFPDAIQRKRRLPNALKSNAHARVVFFCKYSVQNWQSR